MKKAWILVLMIHAILIASISAQAQTPQATLNQYLSDLQKNPSDYALREKIIRHAQTMKPAPAVPDEARKYVNRGMAAAEGAKTESDYKDAIAEFQKAVNIAPWVGAGYRGLAVMQDKAGKYTQALQNLKLFLLTNPPAADAEAAKTLLDKIEYRQERAAKESSPATIAEKKRQEEGDFIKKVDGARYKYQISTNRDAGYWTLDIRGNRVVQGYILNRSAYEVAGVWKQWDETTLNGREFALDGNGKRVCSDFKTKAVETGRISDDGNSINSEQCNERRTYIRER
jgi:tetratricopeptide (TPR) repeat protein